MKFASCVIHGLLALTGTLAVLTSPAQGYDDRWPLIFDWTVSVEWSGNPSPLAAKTLPSGFHAEIKAITPMPKPGYYAMAKEDPKYQALYEALDAQARPMGFMLGSATSPLYGSSDPATLSYMLNQFHTNGHALDYVFVEYEPQFAADKIQETYATTASIRSHHSPLINQAKVGEYDVFGASNLRYMPYPGQNSQENIDRLNNLYDGAGLKVAMPSLYPEESYEVHTSSTYWSVSQRSPNKRIALFWAPLEKFSNAKLNLPAGHWLIPYLNDFVPVEGFSASPPAKSDNAALAQHIRLRGADGYLIWRTMSENEAEPYDNEDYKADVYAAWSALDWLFAAGDEVSILNLTTNKQYGIEWSGVANDNGVAILVSNLSDATTMFTVPAIAGYVQYDAMLPDTITVAAGAHQLVYVQVPEPGGIASLALIAGYCWLRGRGHPHRLTRSADQ